MPLYLPEFRYAVKWLRLVLYYFLVFLWQYRIIRQGDLARNFSSQICVKTQEYFVYFKFSQRICGGKDLGVPTKAQQSGFGGERRSSGATELLPSKGRNEGCKACDDAARRCNCAVLPYRNCPPFCMNLIKILRSVRRPPPAPSCFAAGLFFQITACFLFHFGQKRPFL